MAKRITDEQKEMINELFLEYGVKKKVAEIMGISPASIARYIIPNYVSKKECKTYTFEGQIGNSDNLAAALKKSDNPSRRLCELCMLSDSEWQELKEMQKEIFV